MCFVFFISFDSARRGSQDPCEEQVSFESEVAHEKVGHELQERQEPRRQARQEPRQEGQVSFQGQEPRRQARQEPCQEPCQDPKEGRLQESRLPTKDEVQDPLRKEEVIGLN